MFKKTYRFNTLQPEKMKTKIWLLIFAFLGGKFAYFEIMEFQIFENFVLETIRSQKETPLLLTLFAIHCLTKVSAFVPQCLNETIH